MNIPTRRFRRHWMWLTPLVIIIGICALSVYVTVRWAGHHSRIFANELEQAANAMKKAHINPDTALLQTQTHLAAARFELETLRPLSETTANIASRMTEWPLIGVSARQLVGLWSFAEATTTMGENMADAAQIGQVNFETNGFDGLIAALPTIQAKLQTAETSLVQAQAARTQLGPTGQLNAPIWLPHDQLLKLNAALTQWDTLTPPLNETLSEVNQLLNEIDVAQIKINLQTLIFELEQISAILETTNENPLLTIEKMQKHLEAAQAAFEALRPATEPLLARSDQLASLLATAPLAKNKLPPTNLPQQITAAWHFTEAAMLLGHNLAAVAELGLQNVEQAGMDGVLAAMPAIHNHLQTAQTHLAHAQKARSDLEQVDWLPAELAAPLNTALTQWDTVVPTLEEFVLKAEPLARLLPLLLGNDKPVTYLLMIQSSAELRPSGGFMGSIGVVTVAEGKITAVDLREVVEFDHPWDLYSDKDWPGRIPPPFGLNRYMGMSHWFLRDANWFADFPSTARQVRELWSLQHNIEIDGVMAITDQGVLRLLKAIGPVKTLSGDLVSAETGMAFAAEQIYQRGKVGDIHPQTRLLQEMGLVFAALTRNPSATQLLQLGQFLHGAVDRNDFLITSFDPPLSAALHKLGIDGALGGQQDDYFYLVESNVSVNKSSQFIQQDLNYEVSLSPNGWPILSTLTVDEKNTFRPESKMPGFPENDFNGVVWPFTSPKPEKRLRPEGYYGGFTRVFPPPGSKFKSVTGFDDGPYILEENHRTVAAGYVGLYANEKQQLEFKWVPNGHPTEPGRYRLQVQRQPGAPEHALSVVVQLPPGYRATEISPVPISISAGKVAWHTVLDSDQIFSLRLEDDGGEVAVAPAKNSDTPAVAALSSATPATSTTSTQLNPHPVAPAPAPEPFRAPLPIWLSIPAIGVGAPVVPVGLEPSGIMASPTEADLVGWYEFGPRPGEPSNAIVAAHVDWKGKDGAFARLHELEPGDTIKVQHGPDAGFSYIVESIEAYEANLAPVDEIFGPTPGYPTLTLITCSGPYDNRRQEYQNRLIVRARGMD